MSRARDLRRAQLRKIRRHLGDQGCNCNPPIVPAAEGDALVELMESTLGHPSRGAFDVRHERWCPAGRAHQALVDEGALPVVLFNSGKTCER
jgi:hypothetical protein